MKIEHWSNECRERGPGEEANMLPADVRYLAQWRNDCVNFGQCKGVDSFLFKLKKKYAKDPVILKALKPFGNPIEVAPRSEGKP